MWFAAAVRGIDNPAFCKKGSDHPSAKVFPLDRSGRQVSMLDPKTMKMTRAYSAEDPDYLKGKYTGQDIVQVADAPYTKDECKEQGFIDYSK